MEPQTGHPFVDVGTAAALLVAGKGPRDTLTGTDLEQVARRIQDLYMHPPFRSFLYSILTGNSVYTHNTMSAEKRAAKAGRLLHESRQDPGRPDEPCTYCGAPAWSQRLNREHVPLLTGESVMNFTPNGRPGLAACARCLLKLQALPLAALPCGGFALVAHSEDPELTWELAAGFYEQNLRNISLARAGGQEKLPTLRHPRTRLVEQLLQADQARHQAAVPSVTAYEFSPLQISRNSRHPRPMVAKTIVG